jgi:hypothetical protein
VPSSRRIMTVQRRLTCKQMMCISAHILAELQTD